MTTLAGSAPPAHGDPWEAILAPLIPLVESRLAEAAALPRPGWVAEQLDLNAGPEWDIAIALHRAGKAAARPAEALAQQLAQGFPTSPGIARTQAVGAYLNFSVDPVWLAEVTLGAVADRGDKFGHTAGGGDPACVEHTSANPTGPLHVGRIRNSIIGDTLARVLRAAGRSVTTQYYVDDVGRQAAMITWIWTKPLAEWPPEIRDSLEGREGDAPTERADLRNGRPYPAVSAYLKLHPEAAQEVAAISEALEAGRMPVRHRELTRATLEGMLASLDRIGVKFDELVWESGFLADGSVPKVLERLSRAPHAVRESNGALAIDASQYGLPKETAKVIVARGNGTSLYVTRDLAYHLAKFARFPRVIDVLGQDHLLHARTLEALLQEMGEARRPEFVLYQYMTAPSGKGMSTRKGTAVYLDTLLDDAVALAQQEVRSRWPDSPPADIDRIAQALAAGAVRYHILRVAADKTVAFRWEDALSFEGRSGPFVQYAYVRATSLLKKAEGASRPFPARGEDLTGAEERGLIRTIARWPRTVAYTARTAHVHTIAAYAHDLAEAFNRFYQAVPVLKSGAERSSRLALVDASRSTLASVLDLLGVPLIDRM
ncbi:MAG TPA: arginine--tRNA ligase [Thermoplasmata archaeon]|nr:arginine--tRNA ligase [Thermoplasmata archaeon]